MIIDAILDKDRLVLKRPLLLRHQRVAVRVEIPDEEVVSEGAAFPERTAKPPRARNRSPEKISTVQKRAQEMLDTLAAIRTRPIDEADLPEWTEKRQQRWEAFELRSQVRTEEGRE